MLQLTEGEFISVIYYPDQAAWHGQAISTYLAYFQTWWLFADKNVNKQPFCQQNTSLIMCWWCFCPEKNTIEACFIARIDSWMLTPYQNHRLPKQIGKYHVIWICWDSTFKYQKFNPLSLWLNNGLLFISFGGSRLHLHSYHTPTWINSWGQPASSVLCSTQD